MIPGEKKSRSLSARALDALARREYSCDELARKLKQSLTEGETPEDVAAVISELKERGFLSNERYAAGQTSAPPNAQTSKRPNPQTSKPPNITPGELICRILEKDGCKTGAFFFGMNEANLDRIFAQPWIVPGSDASLRAPWGPLAADHPHPRAYATMPEFYRRVRALGVSREETIARMTSVPARRFGIRGRGVLAKGAFADLVVWDEASFAAKATYLRPHQFTDGVRLVMVNGVVPYANGVFTGRRGGRFLTR